MFALVIDTEKGESVCNVFKTAINMFCVSFELSVGADFVSIAKCIKLQKYFDAQSFITEILNQSLLKYCTWLN